MIIRLLQSVIEQKFFKSKVIIVLGPRQVGKATLMEQISANLLSDAKPLISLNCDEPFTRELLTNALLQNFSPLNLRQDVGALWENFFVSERLKFNLYNRHFVKSYFWRTHQQQEIDLVEETDGNFNAFEIKWNVKLKVTFHQNFINAYKPKETNVVSPQNYLKFLSDIS